MKIQCDVCNKDEAAVFCTADEAALCAACDHRVHHANKLAGKHQRFSLLLPSPKQFPLCDICKERKAFLFCQQDRAILCRDCDVPIHKANEHTKNHNRFLLTGVKLSSTTSLYSSPQPSSSDTSLTNNNNNNKSGCDLVPNLKSKNSINKPNISVQPTILNTPTITKNTTTMTTTTDKCSNESTSSISEYLIDMLPGWRVEDFLDSSPAFSGFCKNVDEVMPIWDGELESNLGSSFSSPQNMGIWVPQAPPLMYPSHQQNTSFNMGFGSQIGFKEVTNNETGRKWRVDDGCFTVPQISPPPSTGPASKRSRTFCQNNF